jgi:IclR family transcriptional regulator, acetate operon repressor
MRTRPPYALESADNALRLLQILRDHGRLRVSEAAEHLGCSRSTAHRLLSVLVYRDFAVQDDRHRYLPGPALSASPVGRRAWPRLCRVLLPHMKALCERVDETVNLIVRAGTQTRFLASVESTRVPHVGDRTGCVRPAAKASSGKVLLAGLAMSELAGLYQPDGAAVAATGEAMSPGEFRRLCHELDAVRGRGFALNLEGTEPGLCAIARCLTDESGRAVGALAVAVPASRFDTTRIELLAGALEVTTQRVAADLNAIP